MLRSTRSKVSTWRSGSAYRPSVPPTYHSTDHNFSDDADVVDATWFHVGTKRKFPDDFDLIQIIDSRGSTGSSANTRIEPVDFLARRTYHDSICLSSSNFDTHGYAVLLSLVKPPDKERLWVFVPYRYCRRDSMASW